MNDLVHTPVSHAYTETYACRLVPRTRAPTDEGCQQGPGALRMRSRPSGQGRSLVSPGAVRRAAAPRR